MLRICVPALARVRSGSWTGNRKLRKALHVFATETSDAKRLTELPGVQYESDLPADPITRLFFQRKAEHALHEGTYDDPRSLDDDRVTLSDRRTSEAKWDMAVYSATYDFSCRITEATEERKRFVIVPSTVETKGAARIMMRHGLIGGVRDFHNDRAFAIELKYFQNESVIQAMEAVTKERLAEFEWSPRMVRAQSSAFGVRNNIRVFILRTWDGRIIDNFEAQEEGIGGRGLWLVY